MSKIEKLKFLQPEQVKKWANEFGTPFFIYDEESMLKQAKKVLNFPNAFGLTVRYAMKANPNKSILNLFYKEGIEIDASSEYEVLRAIWAGIKPESILLTAQERCKGLKDIVERGIHYNATSLQQLIDFGEIFPGRPISVRINPGLGSGGTNRTNVGGPASSFGIWHQEVNSIKEYLKKYNLKLTRIHTHIGSGSDPEVWQKVAQMSIALLEQFPSVEVLNLGGGFKVGRTMDEVSTDLQVIGEPVKEAFEKFYAKTQRKVKCEIEPGSFLMANSGAMITEIQDCVSTGTSGYNFLKIDAGMTDVLRPSIYGALHPLIAISQDGSIVSDTKDYVVSGHCCESGDMFTPKQGDPESLAPRTLSESKIGDFLVIEGVGAYCSSMNVKNYNSFPEPGEFLLKANKSIQQIKRKQLFDEMIQNEI